MIAATAAYVTPAFSPVTDERRPRLDLYVEQFRNVFARADQYRWFAAYLRGLLECRDRRNVESIARHVAEDPGAVAAVGQALNNFIASSPWDDRRLRACYRALVRPPRPARQWVIHDGVFPKHGRCSVGVQRQLARGIDRKINCQVAVVVSAVVQGVCLPLTARLYLPAYWLRQHADLAAAVVPEAFRRPMSKAEIAAELLEELLHDEPFPTEVMAEDGHTGAGALANVLGARDIPLVGRDSDEVLGSAAQVLATFERLKDLLGLDHFEGRGWQGWHHHVSMVMAANGFLIWEKSGLPEARMSPLNPDEPGHTDPERRR